MRNQLDNLLTVIIPVKNEEKNLPDCLESVKELEHVVVVDSGSTDATCDIALRYGREVVQFRWDGKFPKKRNWILRNYSFKTPWVFFLDADERPSKKQLDELSDVLPVTKHNALIMYMDNWFMGRILKHGDHPRKTNVLRLGTGEYEMIAENHWSNMDMEVNEHIIVSGTMGFLRNHLEHYDKRTLASYYQKHNEYSSWEANRFMAMSKESFKKQTIRQKIKYGLIYKNRFFPFLYFLYSYLFKGGIWDGKPGFFFTINRMFYFYQIQAKIKLLKDGIPQ